RQSAAIEGDESRSVGDRAASASTAAGRRRGAGEQDGGHRMGGDAAPERTPAPGCGGFVRLGRRWRLREGNEGGWHTGAIRRNREKPADSSGHRSRSNDEDSVRGPHQGQQSTRTAPTGRTHECKRPLRCTPNDLLPGGGHPHMKRCEFITVLAGGAA